MTFVRADRTLRRLGRQRCLVIALLRPGQRVSFHLVLHVNANAPAGTVDNIADVTPGVEPAPFPAPAPGAPAPGSAPAPGADASRLPTPAAGVAGIRAARAVVRVRRGGRRTG